MWGGSGGRGEPGEAARDIARGAGGRVGEGDGGGKERPQDRPRRPPRDLPGLPTRPRRAVASEGLCRPGDSAAGRSRSLPGTQGTEPGPGSLTGRPTGAAGVSPGSRLEERASPR